MLAGLSISSKKSLAPFGANKFTDEVRKNLERMGVKTEQSAYGAVLLVGDELSQMRTVKLRRLAPGDESTTFLY